MRAVALLLAVLLLAPVIRAISSREAREPYVLGEGFTDDSLCPRLITETSVCFPVMQGETNVSIEIRDVSGGGVNGATCFAYSTGAWLSCRSNFCRSLDEPIPERAAWLVVILIWGRLDCGGHATVGDVVATFT